jgi:hypothetical protein
MNKEKETKKAAASKTAKRQNPEGLDISKFLPDAIPDSAEEKKIVAALEKMLRGLPKILDRQDARRPTPNPQIPPNILEVIVDEFDVVRMIIEYYAANIRQLDRKRLNSIGVKKQGFVDRAYASAVKNTNFMPPYLTIEKYSGDFTYFNRLRDILELLGQLREYIWNLVIQASDVTYTDTLEYYATVREAAERRIDGAESIHNELEPFFSKAQSEKEEPTKEELVMDAKALINSKHDGKIVIENVSPKVTGGVHKVVDEKFTGSEQFKESAEGEIKE